MARGLYVPPRPGGGRDHKDDVRVPGGYTPPFLGGNREALDSVPEGYTHPLWGGRP